MTDTEITARIAEGELHLFDELAARCRSRLRIIAMRYMHNVDDAEDVVQTALSKAYRYIATYNGKASLDVWLMGITRHAAIDALRRRTVDSTLPLDDIPVDYHPADTSIDSDPERLTLRNLDVARVRSSIAHLAPNLQSVCILHELEDYPQHEVAAALGIPQGTVKSRLNRARAQLRDRLIPTPY